MSLLLWFRAHGSSPVPVPNLVQFIDGTFAASTFVSETLTESTMDGDALLDSA